MGASSSSAREPVVNSAKIRNLVSQVDRLAAVGFPEQVGTSRQARQLARSESQQEGSQLGSQPSSQPGELARLLLLTQLSSQQQEARKKRSYFHQQEQEGSKRLARRGLGELALLWLAGLLFPSLAPPHPPPMLPPQQKGEKAVRKALAGCASSAG